MNIINIKKQLSSDSHFRYQVAVALFLLVAALLHGLFMKNVPVDGVQAYNWFFNYNFEKGYNHRGVMGSIFQFFHGAPSQQKIRAIIPSWEYNILNTIIIFAWCLLVPRALLIPVSHTTKWLLLSISAVLLVAPVWRASGVYIGSMDKWVIFVVFLALSSFIANKPWLYLFFALLGFLIHPMMIFFQLLFFMLMCHAVCFAPAYQKKHKQWLITTILPFIAAVVLYFLNNPQNSVDMLVEHKFTSDELFMKSIINDVARPESLTAVIANMWAFFPGSAAAGLMIFGGIPLLWSIAVAFALRKSELRLSAIIPERYMKKFPALAFMERNNLFIILPLASIFSLPVNISSIDWSRHLYWSWWGMTVALVYIIWTLPFNPPPSHPTRIKSRKNKDRHGSDAARVLSITTATFFVMAYVFLGSPLNVSHLNRPWVFHCGQFCIPMLTVNPAGKLYSDAVFSTLKSTLLPINGDGENIKRTVLPIWDYSVENGKLRLPAEYAGLVFKLSFTVDRGHNLAINLTHEIEDPSIIYLAINNGEAIKPFRQTQTESEWRFGISQTSLPEFKIYTKGGQPITLSAISIDRV